MESGDARLRVGLVGAGLIGQTVHAHYLWEERARFEFVAVADPSAAIRAAVGDRYAIGERHPSLAGLLALDLDAIVVAGPDAFHAEMVCEGLAAGLHVLCEKPLALSLEECDRIAAARDASRRVLQVGTMKRYDPAYLRLLELLPASAGDLHYLSVEVRDPGSAPFVVHRQLTAGSDLAPEVIEELRARTAAMTREAAGDDPPPGAARAFRGFLSSLVHDVSLLQGVLEQLGEPWCERADDGAWWDGGRGVSLSASLPGGGRAHLVHHHLPGVADYSERLTLHCRDRVLELTFPSPYLLHRPTRLVEHRPDGALGLRSIVHRVSYEEAFQQQLRAFAEACAGRAPVVTPAEAGRADIALLLDGYRHAVAREAAAYAAR